MKAGTAAAGTGQIKFEPSTLLTTPETGVLEFANGKLYITNVAHRRSIDRTSDVSVATVTVASTADETVIWTADMGANSLTAGNVFKAHADGIVSNGGPTAADRITVRVKVGAATVVTLTPVAGNLTSRMWHLDANATQRTIGNPGSRAIHLHLVVGDEESMVFGVADIDTTSNMDVSITVQWASAAADNTISLYQGYMEYKN